MNNPKGIKYSISPQKPTIINGLPKEGVPEMQLKFYRANRKKNPGSVRESKEVANFIRTLFKKGEIVVQEQFIILYLNRKNAIIGYYKHTKGAINATIADVRLILAAALKSGSSSIILAHNHPSGNNSPSQADLQITKKIKMAAGIMDIKLLDHLIITEDSHYSMADNGQLEGVDSIAPSNMDKYKIKDQRLKISNKASLTRYHYNEEVFVAKRLLNMHGKEKTIQQILRAVHWLQKKIKDKKIRSSSPYARQIEQVQTALVELYNKMEENKLSTTKVTIEAVFKSELENLVSPADLTGIDNSKRLRINSDELEKLQFNSIGFIGKWLDFIGDPEPGFSALIFGKPKFGKSFLSVEWAGYLSKHHGKVAYIAKEEGISTTIKDKLVQTSAGNPNLVIFNYMPDDKELSEFDFVFLDSVQRLHISPDQENELKDRHPRICFIAISQTTKNGAFRGSNTREHDVDVVIEVPERGKAIQYGRFNQGGEMEIF